MQPRQTFYVFYKASAETLPNWFCIYATFTGATTASGLKLAFKLPHTVYLLGKNSLDRSQVQWVRAETSVDGDKRRITAEVENLGTGFSRVRQIDVTATLGKQAFPGFPLFPGQKRVIELDWAGPGTPRASCLVSTASKPKRGFNPFPRSRDREIFSAPLAPIFGALPASPPSACTTDTRCGPVV